MKQIYDNIIKKTRSLGLKERQRISIIKGRKNLLQCIDYFTQSVGEPELGSGPFKRELETIKNIGSQCWSRLTILEGKTHLKRLHSAGPFLEGAGASEKGTGSPTMIST